MDTLTAALNVARLVALSRSPAAAYLRQALRRGAAGGLDLEAMLANVSQQIDFELKVLETPAHQRDAAAEFVGQAVGEALGLNDAPVDLEAMKRDRITMVAHLVARVREVLAEAEATPAS